MVERRLAKQKRQQRVWGVEVKAAEMVLVVKFGLHKSATPPQPPTASVRISRQSRL